ncbi:hypothetical protein D3C71_1533130 [compost metagenome]
MSMPTASLRFRLKAPCAWIRLPRACCCRRAPVCICRPHAATASVRRDATGSSFWIFLPDIYLTLREEEERL